MIRTKKEASRKSKKSRRQTRRQSRHQSRHQSRRQSKRQSGGGWAYGGLTYPTAAGIPLDVRTVTDECAVTQRGGSGTACSANANWARVRTRRNQLGGGCGCMIPAPQAGGSYSVNIASNDLGKVPVYAYMPCGFQKGGMSPIVTPPPAACKGSSAFDSPAYTASYTFKNPVDLPTGARYFDVTAQGGKRK